ncbi:hypothetical protein PRK78_006206 [Emydomyces testavorans]|uniref:SUZ domain-containing protein n=1 Tax=Emydomyces testavorans TaxID=2070801 RepID=A0AAF0IND5_9EURO|nr:hypothetical protein PRK78_006206 [Emydomyces testavorans]
MSKTKDVPDAWDDDWEEQVDSNKLKSPTLPPASQQEPEKKLSSRAKKAQLRAQHAEFNRQLWAEAEAEVYVFLLGLKITNRIQFYLQEFINISILTFACYTRIFSESTQMSHYLESRSTIPLKTEYKPAVKVLSRNPQSPAGLGATTVGLQKVTISPRPASRNYNGNNANENKNDDDDSDDNESPRQKQPTAEERLAIAQREREEKQRKYEEARERLFGSSNAGSGASTPGNTTPPPRPQHTSGGENNKWKGKTRSNGNSKDRGEKRDSSSRSAKGKQLYDPNHSPKPHSNQGKRKENRSQMGGGEESRLQSQSPQLQTPIRSPKGPDGSGPGGFGFAQRDGGSAPR